MSHEGEDKIDRIGHVLNANNVALKYLAELGIVVFNYEVTSIFKSNLAWFITIEGEFFNGIVVIKSKTGDITHIKF